MARNGSGTHTIPNTFVSGNSITASGHNQNFADVSAEITNSVAADGQTTMTGPLKAANGTAGAPSITIASDTDSGFYRKAANSIALSLGGADTVVFTTASATFAGGLGVTGEFIASATASFILTANFSSVVKSASTSHWLVPVGTTGQQPGSPAEGMFRQNSTTHIPEMYNGTSWAAMQALLVQGSFKNLSIKVASNTTVTVAADFVATTDGSSYQLNAVSSTVNLATTGADALDTGTIAVNKWYAIWVIAKVDGTTKCLASLSATAPTMPATYTFKARVGWVQTINGSATLYGTWQFGRRAQYIVGLAQTTVAPVIANGTIGGYSSTSPGPLSSVTVVGDGKFVPSTASSILINATNSWKGGTIAAVIVAPNSSWGGTNNGPLGSVGMIWPLFLNTTVETTVQVNLLLEAATIAWASGNTGGAIACLGWEDNI